MLHHNIEVDSEWWTWDELCNYERTAASRAQQPEVDRVWKVRYSATTAKWCPKEQVVWHESLFRHLLVHVHRELNSQMREGERMLIICFLRRVSQPVAALLAALLSEEDAKACGCGSLGQCSWTDR